MQIDWKHLANTAGYISLKKAMIGDIIKKHRSKEESLRKFNWVISRAKHYAYHLNKPLHEVLNEWEEGRTYWWLNYYQGCKQPKLTKTLSVLPLGIKGCRKAVKQWQPTAQETKNRVCKEIQRLHKQNSKKLKPRWSMATKKRYLRLGR